MRAIRPLILFGIGGILYYFIEIIWRGYSHWTMFLLGGICFLLVGLINEIFELSLVKQMTISTVIITIAEFICGCIVNLQLGWNIWDYSELPMNILGQICLPYSILWFFLSLIAIILDDYLRNWLFGEEKPKYKLFKRG
ncbi:putative ABC transporter permease [Faecalicatena acetigenes]|uniref:ABC transporter permease n=1 Tax=Faecalicatena acetigenes TaxID=2981790 RepID=A0ABT2TCP4_9FIRM|nr:putative ABC transporter permease [Faecalicatena acetigenes]MCU6748058.1 putative ABC transporter permease [Faecalicatena acetigenes]SCI23628.1 Predicted membrane protein [uncultured Clostridium sp.]